MKRNVKITIAVLIIFVGICILSSSYLSLKKEEVFNEMNLLYYEQILSLNTEISQIDEDQTIEESASLDNEVILNPVNEEFEENPEVVTQINNESKEVLPYYVGTIKIPLINLEQGFTSKDSKYNNVNKNIYVHPSSDMPDKDKGNVILAAHSGSSSISYFKNLYKLNKGDDVYLNYGGIEYHYVIRKIYTDSKDGYISIRRNEEKNSLTLITCTKNDKTTQTIYIAELV